MSDVECDIDVGSRLYHGCCLTSGDEFSWHRNIQAQLVQFCLGRRLRFSGSTFLETCVHVERYGGWCGATTVISDPVRALFGSLGVKGVCWVGGAAQDVFCVPTRIKSFFAGNVSFFSPFFYEGPSWLVELPFFIAHGQMEVNFENLRQGVD